MRGQRRADEPDVAVVGCGIAGAATAALIALRGRAVTLFDRAAEPGPDSAEALPPGVHPVLAELGLRERLLAAPRSTRSHMSELDWGNGAAPWRSSLADAGAYGYGFHVSYQELTELLIRRASELGATVRRGCVVLGPVLVDDTVVGVRIRAADGVDRVHEAAVVVDASGPSRVVAGAVSPSPGHNGPRYTIERDLRVTSMLPRRPEPHTFVTGRAAGTTGWTWLIPLGDGTTERATLRLARTGADTRGRQVWSGYRSSVLAGHGWLSVGDAAGVVDPLFLAPAALALLAAQPAAGAIESLLDGSTRVPRHYSDVYGDVLDRVGEFADFCLDPRRQYENEDTLTRNLTGLLGSRESGATLARVRGALDGSHPLFDVDCPEGPLVASLAMPAPERPSAHGA